MHAMSRARCCGHRRGASRGLRRTTAIEACTKQEAAAVAEAGADAACRKWQRGRHPLVSAPLPITLVAYSTVIDGSTFCIAAAPVCALSFVVYCWLVPTISPLLAAIVKKNVPDVA